MYKKVYVEITNNCNLNCNFCIHNERPKRFMNIDEFKTVLEKIKGHTRYLYLHVLGEPLLHPNINEFINFASSDFNVNLTTNGYLIKRIKENKNIRQINISLQSFDEKYQKSLQDYMNDIFSSVDTLKHTTYISYRIWVENKYTDEILNILSKKYNMKIDKTQNKNITLEKNVFLSFNDEFTWPDLNNKDIYEKGNCYALKDHIGILVDGTVIPCCLDSKGTINLGNIYKSTIEEIINGKRYQNMLIGFLNNKKCEELCKKCNFIK